MLKRIVIFLTSILLLLNSALVNATTINGWFLSNPTAVGASILYDGTKGSLTSSILISPNATQVAKVLRGGIAGIALSFAVEQLLGAVDWVLDPANNEIRYKEKANDPTFNYVYLVPVNGVLRRIQGANAVCKAYTSGIVASGEWVSIKKIYTDVNSTGYSITCRGIAIKSNGMEYGYQSIFYRLELPEKTLSLITAAQQVIENAESDNLDAQFAVLAAATNILSEAEQDDAEAKPIADELENNTKCPSGIVRNGSCWVCDKSLFMPYTRATRDAKTATRGKSCKNVTDTTVKTTNATLFRNLINARVQENACWSPPDPNHAIALTDAQNALSLCEN